MNFVPSSPFFVLLPSLKPKRDLNIYMELSKNFEPTSIEAKWYAHWQQMKYFNSKPDGRPSFTVVIPPPNVTGVLHMGHTLNETVQDILVRKARMTGFNACWKTKMYSNRVLPSFQRSGLRAK